MAATYGQAVFTLLPTILAYYLAHEHAANVCSYAPTIELLQLSSILSASLASSSFSSLDLACVFRSASDCRILRNASTPAAVL